MTNLKWALHQPSSGFRSRSRCEGKGIAESLLRKSIELTQSWGENVLYLHTSDKMQAAIRLYERMGFERALDKEFVNQNGTHVKSYQYVIKKEQPAGS